MTIALANMALGMNVNVDSARRVITINKAIAQRELNDSEGMEKTIADIDWSSCSPHFIVAVRVLRAEKEKMYSSLEKAVASEDIEYDEVYSWSLFKHLIGEEEFSNKVDELFHKQ